MGFTRPVTTGFEPVILIYYPNFPIDSAGTLLVCYRSISFSSIFVNFSCIIHTRTIQENKEKRKRNFLKLCIFYIFYIFFFTVYEININYKQLIPFIVNFVYYVDMSSLKRFFYVILCFLDESEF